MADHVPPTQLDALPETVAASGSRRRVLRMNDEGGRTGWSQMPGGWVSPYARPGIFEMHSNDEEVFVLEGEIRFGEHYTVTAGTYINHPPFWVHPSDESNDPVQHTTLLTKTSRTTDFHFEPIPEQWDGQEYFGGPAWQGPRGKGHTALRYLDVPAGPVLWHGQETGLQARTLWFNPRDGWTTWICEAPAGWEAPGLLESVPGGDELFLLEGDLETRVLDETARLAPGGYYQSGEVFTWPGGVARSRGGFRAVRWTKVAGLGLPDPA